MFFQSNKPDIAQRLLEGRANPTIRNQITGWVPLHEASWNGHIECANILLQWDAPVMSRTPKVFLTIYCLKASVIIICYILFKI